MRPRRILYFLNSSVRAGVEEHVLSLLAGLDRDRYVSALCCPAPLLDAFASDLAALPVTCYPVDATSWTRPREMARLARAIVRFGPDIVHTHLFRATLVAAPLAKALRVPVVVETYHGREAWRRGRIKGSFAVDRLVARHVDAVIAVSDAAARFLIDAKRLPATKVQVIPNGRDLSAFRQADGTGAAVRRELGIADGAPVLGVVGRLESQKGHRYLVDALPHVTAKVPDVRVLVTGDGSLRGELERQAAAAGLGNIVFTGFRDDIPRLIAAMDVVVLPSLYEGMPLVAIEAAAAGKPIVATAVDGTPEVVQDRVSGLLVPPADTDALGAAILELLNAPDMRTDMGAAAARLARERFDIRRQIAETEALYRSAWRART